MVCVSDLENIEAIKQVKYRYLRALDTKHWDDFAATLAEDVTADYGKSMGTEHKFTDRDSLVDFMRSSLPANVISEHRVSHPEITLTGPDTASGIWYLQDRVIMSEYDLMLIGAAFYHDQYRRTSEGWKISDTGYQRTYDATMPLSSVPGFKVTPGDALHC
ncbi:nuclear transport factor 2 family protein [Mycobacterium sp. CSUR Q5927]|nr:nuclear transport factor 2 family protein [Mycobacterium sp. CSUR Q5927]